MKIRYLKDVVTLQLDEKKCTSCGICIEVCPHEVLLLKDKQVRIHDHDACIECGACAINCPFNAITVRVGVGCAAAIIRGGLTGGEPCCDRGDCC